MTDENTRKLIKLYRKTKSEKMFSTLVNGYQNVVYKRCGVRQSIFFSYNERVSIGNEFLMQAIENKYQLDSPMKFLTYLYNRIPLFIIDKERGLSAFKKEEGKRIFYNPYVSYDNPDFTNTHDTNSTFFIDMVEGDLGEQDKEVENEQLMEILFDVMSKLPPPQKAVMGLIYHGQTQTEISLQLGLHESRISQLKKSGGKMIYEKLKEKLNGEVGRIKTLLMEDYQYDNPF